MFKKDIQRIIFLFVLMIISCFISNAQSTVSSPYSRYGIGNTNLFDNAINNSMGGVGYTLKRNYHVNSMNPASYSGIDTTSFVFDIGFYSEWLSLKTTEYKSSGNNTNLSHILVAFPLSKRVKMALGMKPFSTVDFVTIQNVYDTILGSHKKIYAGDGGINKIMAGFAYEPLKDLSLGINLEYLFGNYYKSSTITFPDSSYFYSTRKEQNYRVNALNINLGLQYFYKLENEDKLGIGIVYNLPMKLPTKNTIKTYSFVVNGGNEYLKDSVEEIRSKGVIEIPQLIGVGFSYERQNKFFISLDGSYSNWSEFKFQQHATANSYQYVDEYKIALGGEWKPNAYGNYLQKIIYRAGLNYNNGLLDIQNTRIRQFGISLGAGIPIKKSNTLINISLEYGKRGTKEYNLIQEDYFRLGISFSAKDIWFMKRKYQ